VRLQSGAEAGDDAQAHLRDKARGCAVSPDARWVAVTHDDRLAVYERATQREACAWRRGGRQVRAWWCDADELLVRWYGERHERIARLARRTCLRWPSAEGQVAW